MLSSCYRPGCTACTRESVIRESKIKLALMWATVIACLASLFGIAFFAPV